MTQVTGPNYTHDVHWIAPPVSPPDTASLIYHDAINRASNAIAAYNTAAYQRIEADELADKHRASLASIKAELYAQVADQKNEAARNAALTELLDKHEEYQTFAAFLAHAERTSAEQRVAMDVAVMEHSLAKRQLEFAAASVRGLS